MADKSEFRERGGQVYLPAHVVAAVEAEDRSQLIEADWRSVEPWGTLRSHYCIVGG